jgi:hypothetical protein
MAAGLSTQGPGILWNTKYLEVAYTELRRQGGPINEDLLRHVAPLGWEHIGLTGDYVWSPAKKEPTDSGGAAATARAARPRPNTCVTSRHKERLGHGGTSSPVSGIQARRPCRLSSNDLWMTCEKRVHPLETHL